MKIKTNPRQVIQLLSLLASAVFLVFIILGAKAAIHAICPYATVCFGLSKASLFGVGANVFMLTVALGFAFLVSTIFVGRMFCGYLCPLGTIQEAVFSPRGRKYRKQHQIPYFYEKRFASLKYAILLITTALSIGGIGYVYIRLCPIYALSLLPRLAMPGLAVLLLIVIAGVFQERFWCRFLCPYAALMNIFQGLGKLFGLKRRKIHRNLERCVDCGICMLYCPMNLNIAEDEYVHSAECIHCDVCANKCPKPGTFCCEKET